MSKDTVREEQPKPQTGRAIATTGDGRDITRGYVGPLLIPDDSILRSRGSDLALYEQVFNDAEVKATFAQRQLAVTQCEWQVDAGGDRAIDKAAADFMREQIHAIGWDRITSKMLFGVFYGYAVAELIYEVQGRYIGIKEVRVRNRRRFRFDKDMGLRLLTYSEMAEGERAQAPYFWSFATGADHDDEPYGLGLAHWLYWPVLFKRNGIKFWLIFLEKFGMPTSVGRYEADTSDGDKQRLLAATRALQTDSGIILPKGMELDLLEAARSGTSDYKALHDAMDATIQKVVLGQTASTQGTPGKLGNDKLQGDVRDDIIKADADLVCESWNMGPARWLTAWNFAGAKTPRVYRITDAPEDLGGAAERVAKLRTAGFKPTLARMVETFGEGWVETPVAASGLAPDATTLPDTQGAAFAEGEETDTPDTPSAFPDQDALTQILDALDDGSLDEQAAALLQPLVTLAERDPQAALDAIAGVLPDMDDSALQNTLARAMFIADVWGRFHA